MNLDRIIAVRNSITVFRDNELCIKMFNSDYAKADVYEEAFVHATVEATGLSMPKIREVSSISGKWSIVSDYIKGKSLARLASENPEKKEEYIELLAKLQVQIHEKSCPRLYKLSDRFLNAIMRSDLSATLRYDLASRLDKMPMSSGLCHGDLDMGNIVIDENGNAFIVDWAQAACGAAAADVALTYRSLLLEDGSECADKYLSFRCTIGGVANEDVESWLPLAAAARIVDANERQRGLLAPYIN